MNVAQDVHPLSTTFARLSEMSAYIKAYLGRPENDGWVAPLQSFTPGSSLLNERRASVQQQLHTETANIVGSSLLQGYQWLVISVAVGSFLIDRRVPDLDVEQIWVRASAHDVAEVSEIAFMSGRFAALSSDPAAAHPDATIFATEDELRVHLRTTLEAHFSPLINLIHAAVGTATRGLWLNVADRCAVNLIRFMQAQGEKVSLAAIQHEIEQMLRIPGSPLKSNKTGVIALTYQQHTHCFLERATCCYWHRTDGGQYCATCPHRSQAERRQLHVNKLTEKYAEPVSEAAD